MPDQKEPLIATSGYSGFMPSMRYQFGLTYGHATKKLIEQDTKKPRKIKNSLPQQQESITSGNDQFKWRNGKILSTVDDRFSSAPVPGYTGYIPRSHEHFGAGFAQTTQEALKDFQKVTSNHKLEPETIQNLKSFNLQGSNEPIRYPAPPSELEESSPYKISKGHPNQTFLGGYTGFIPRHQKFLGERYAVSVRHAIEDFLAYNKEGVNIEQKIPDPIPGFTGFVPGCKYAISDTFGRASHSAYEAFANRDPVTGKIHYEESGMLSLDRNKNKPISGYKGHTPGKK